MIVCVLDRLALSNAQTAQHARPKEFSAILNVAEEIRLELPPEVVFHHLPLRDFVPIPSQKMREAIRWISQHIATHRVLVCCNAGVGRSASVVIGYLCSVGFGYGEAVEFVARKKPDISTLPRLIETIEEALAP